ncbi:MAG: TauD/TfdA family dioxygenase [Acidobacteria bacterium]|nr:TauD/TfdA family dioxygenase [Acidobacteriota bacterium]
MIIEQTPVHDAPFTGSGAWRGSDFRSAADWTSELSPAMLAELDRSMRRIQKEGKRLAELSAADYDVPSFARDGEALRLDLESGRGFAVLRGLPVDEYTEEQAAILYYGIATLLGQPIVQNRNGDLLFSVRDEGYDFVKQYGTLGVRISRTASAIDFHTDSSAAYAGNTPDIVGLLALRMARSGGVTAIASAQTLHNTLLEERPEYLERLYLPYLFDRQAELRPGEPVTLNAPVFMFRDNLTIRYFRFNLMKGHETAGVPLSPADTDPIDYLESICRRQGIAVEFEMRRGDIQFVNNRFILHSRTAFEDYPEPERRRHLLRLWLAYRGTG